MNSYRRARRRPRVESVSFRSFGWVLLREAAVAILVGSSASSLPWSVTRSYLAKVDGARVRLLVAKCLAVMPHRRTFPC